MVARFFADGAARNSCRGGPKKAVSLNAMRTSIRCFCAHLHDAGLVSANPARLLRRARCAPPPPKALHADEQERLLEVLAAASGPEAERDRMLVELLLGTGIRVGSALALDVEDIDFHHGEIALRRTKNDRPATGITPVAVAEKLRCYRSFHAFRFCQRKRKKLIRPIQPVRRLKFVCRLCQRSRHNRALG